MRRELEKDAKKFTRREFARAAGLAAATAAVAPTLAAAVPAAGRSGGAETAGAMGRAVGDADGRGTIGGAIGRAAGDAASARQAEIDARVAEVLRRYGDRLSAEEKSEVRRLAGELQKGLDKLRAYPLGNGDQPATVLRVVPDLTEVGRAARR